MTRIALTAGEPAGIGPDVILQCANQLEINADIVVIADKHLLAKRATELGISLNLIDYNIHQTTKTPSGSLSVWHVPLEKACETGTLNAANAHYVLKTLTLAGTGCLQGQFDALVTGPVHKGIINDAGINFSGHTEFFAKLTQTEHVVMMLTTDKLRVALATTHIPLANVAQAITQEKLIQIIQVLNHDLKKYFAIPKPRINVCGLNPHAGEQGHLGREEIEIIIPVLERLRAQGIQLNGPLPADTLFTPQALQHCDVVLAMYHDQGLPVLKHQGFGRAVNVTLGLPIIRTSVDHGTALSLAGSGKADSGSLQAALSLAKQLAKQSQALTS